MDQKKRGLKYVKISLAIVVSLVVLFFVGRYILYTQIRKTIETELANLKDQDIFVEYDHLELHPWVGKIEFIRFSVKVSTDRDRNGIDAAIPYVLIKGIDIWPYLRNKTLALQEISLQQASVTYASGATLFQKDSNQKRKIELKNILIAKIHLPEIDLYIRDSLATDTVAHVLAHVNMKDILISKQLDSMAWKEGNVDVTDLAIRMYQESYGISAKKIQFAIEDKSIQVDSFRVKPVIGRIAYMNEKGKQIDYVDALITRLNIRGIDWFVYPRNSLDIDAMEMSFSMRLYRDKRYPFRQYKDRALPSEMLQRLPVQLMIDSIIINDSFVRYEEYPEVGDSSGMIFFDKLHATITAAHNIPRLKKEMKMVAFAKFMGAGNLNANFTFPYDTLQPYYASGTLENMPLVKLNTMLGAAAKAKIESGNMSQLKFNFSYTPLKSNGEIEMFYEDLKIQALRENRKNEQAVSLIKTLLLNTFIIKKDMNEDMSDDKRKGSIDFYRDTKRSIFNYWWKSILSGVKSAYNLDNLPVGGIQTQQKKENRKIGRKKKEQSEVVSSAR